MRLQDLTARAHSAGHRIDLAWVNPDPVNVPGVRVVRRERTHPLTPEDGVVVADGVDLTSATDTGLRGETAYYYTVFPFSVPPTAPPRQYQPDSANRVSALATAAYDTGGRLYSLLPAVYRRFDAPLAPPPGSTPDPLDADRGQLRRFLDLPGQELDALYSLTRALLDVRDVERTEGRLLPLLAQWIGWPTDERLPLSAQRLQIRLAPRLYAEVGAPPVVRSTVARITGWPSRVKEYVHNVARTNEPERLTLWSAVRDAAGTWTPDAPLSTHAASAGRIRHVRDRDSSELFVFHVQRRHGPDIWAKRFTAGSWQSSEPLVDRPGLDLNPAVALQGDTLWLFWETYDPAAPEPDRRWRIAVRTRTTDGTWTGVDIFADDTAPRRSPAAVIDGVGNLWLFWREWLDGRWQIRYARHDGNGWQPDPPATMPDDGGEPVTVEDDLVALHHPSAGQIWLFWARREPGGPAGQSRWSIAWRVKAGTDPAAQDWSVVRLVPKDDAADREREPYPLVTATGDVELFRASTRGGAGWTVVRSVLTVATLTWGPVEDVATAPAGSRRAPAPASLADPAGATLLVLRSASAVTWTPRGPVAGAPAGTLDTRYGGTRTVLADDAGARARRGRFEDDQSYTYQAGTPGVPGQPPVRTETDRVSRDTVGIFLTPDTTDPATVAAAVQRLGGVLREFMPLTARAVPLGPDGEVIPR
jgi:hypothetical protein